MPRLGDLPLVQASVPATATLAEAVELLFAAQVPAIAIVDEGGVVGGILAEGDVLRAVYPGYLSELHHTAFLVDDPVGLSELMQEARDKEVGTLARPVEPLDAGESQTHAAERFIHCGESALPVVDDGRFVGMLSVAALFRQRLAAPGDA